jgi:serine/threonine protein kinase
VSKRLSLDDESVVRHLRAYQEALEAGERPDRRQMLARFPQIAEELARCLDGLDFVHRVAPQLRDEDLPGRDLDATTPLGDFQIVREVGRGGMGVVYEAEQMSLGRRVALKVLPFAAVLDDRYLRRFKNEAQAAAHLHHTNIVPVHAVGCERGVHYYAMQFIEGSTVAGLIDELRGFAGNSKNRDSSPALEAIAKEHTTESPRYCRAVANLGIQAAEALEYAHESGVIHRDIKPPNLIVDASGHLWITDFGLASTRNDTGLTVTGDIVGTMRYMSPEQALAQRVPVDHRTDIYSLGVTLYELLTLEQAFPGDDPRAILQDIAFKEPVRPRALNPATAPELETILLKAMAKDARDRYETAQELVDDLRRFLENRPIHARRPTLFKRATQWARRHQAVVWAAAVVLVLAVAGLAIGTILLARKHDQVKTAQERAEAHFGKARALVDSMLTRLSEELASEPFMKPLRKELLEEALAFYLDFLEQKEDEPGLRFDAALAHRRVGTIYNQLGRYAESVPSHERAILSLEELVEEVPGEPDYRYELAFTLAQLAYPLESLERSAETEPALRRAVSLLQELLATSGPQVRYHRLLANCHLHLSVVFGNVSRPEDAEREIERGKDIWERLAAASDLPRDRRGLAQSLLWLAQRRGLRNRPDEAEELLQRYLAMIEQLMTEIPSMDLRFAHARGWHLLGNLLYTRRPKDAASAYEEALSIYDELARFSPSWPDAREHVGEVHTSLGGVYLNMGLHKKSDQAVRAAIGALAELADEHPEVPLYRLRLANAHSLLADVARTTGSTEKAEEACRRAIEIVDGLEEEMGDKRLYLLFGQNVHETLVTLLVNRGALQQAERYLLRKIQAFNERLVERYPDVPSYRDLLAQSNFNLAFLVLQPAGRHEEATETERIASGIWSDLAAKHPEDYGGSLARAYGGMAVRLRDTGESQRALMAFEKAIELSRDRLQQADSAYARLGLGVRCYELGLLLRNLGHRVRAEEAYREAVEHLQKAVDLEPGSPEYRSRLASGRINLANLLRGAHRNEEALPLLRQGLAAFDALAREFPGNPNYRREVAIASDNLGITLYQMGRLDEARQSLRKALTVAEGVVEDFGDSLINATTLATALNDLAFMLSDDEEERGLLERAIVIRRKILEANPRHPQERRFVIAHHINLASVLERMGRRDEAEARVQDALPVARELVVEFPDSLADKKKLASLLDAGARLRLLHGDLPQARVLVDELTALYRQIPVQQPDPVAESCNGLAWLLATCPDRAVRDPAEAVRLARRALARSEGQAAHIFKTLGVALYRAGRLSEAGAALERSIELSSGASACDWLFLSMVQHRLGNEGAARKAFAKGEARINKDDARLQRFRAEAEEVLGIKPE